MNSPRQSSDPPNRTAVVAGATGLIGGHLLTLLDAAPEYARVIALTRRPLPHAVRRIESRAADFDRLPTLLHDVAGTRAQALDVFCALGTTIKVAGSRDAFRRVDFDYVLQLASWAKSAAAAHFIVVSALGAGATSTSFYNRVKGEMEDAVRDMGLRAITVLRPSLLSGDRGEFRLGERLALAFTAPFRRLMPADVRPVAAADVAATMLLAARDAAPPSTIESKRMYGAWSRVYKDAGAA